jgi:O-acetyl-ADP-ribose deacetylase (regulator of RNase III)
LKVGENMIEFKTGDILNEDAEALVNTVNCVGIMGRGVALQFKNMFPENFKAYAAACARNEVQPGRMFVFETGELTNPRYIINFPTKRHWRGKSRMEDIESGLVALVKEIRARRIRSIAIPPLGSGLGGLDWKEVRPRIEAALRDLADVRVAIYEPGGAPAVREMVRNRDVPAMTPGRAALVGLMHRYLGGLLDPFVTLLEVHKLMYFMQEAGEPLKLQYQKAPFGPYAENLRHVLRAVEGHLISGYADGGDAPDKQIELVPGAIKDANAFLEDEEATRQRFDKVAELVEGFESPFGLELLATVHWVATRETPKSLEDIIAKTYSWNERKKRFTPRQIALATDMLARKGWVASVPRRKS